MDLRSELVQHGKDFSHLHFESGDHCSSSQRLRILENGESGGGCEDFDRPRGQINVPHKFDARLEKIAKLARHFVLGIGLAENLDGEIRGQTGHWFPWWLTTRESLPRDE